jgi:hypothetical protein
MRLMKLYIRERKGRKWCFFYYVLFRLDLCFPLPCFANRQDSVDRCSASCSLVLLGPIVPLFICPRAVLLRDPKKGVEKIDVFMFAILDTGILSYSLCHRLSHPASATPQIGTGCGFARWSALLCPPIPSLHYVLALLGWRRNASGWRVAPFPFCQLDQVWSCRL